MPKSKKKSRKKDSVNSDLEVALVEEPVEREEGDLSDYAEPRSHSEMPENSMKLHHYEAYVHKHHPKTGMKAYQVREGIFAYLREEFRQRNLEMTLSNIKSYIKKEGVGKEYAQVILEWKKLGKQRKSKGTSAPNAELNRLSEEFPPGIYAALAHKYNLPKF